MVGVRVIELSKAPFHRRFGRKILDKLAGVEGLEDSQSGFRAYSKEAIRLIEISESDFGVDPEILMKAKSLGIKYIFNYLFWNIPM